MWAPNKGHKIEPAKNLVSDLRAAQQAEVGRETIISILEKHGKVAARR